MDKNKNKKNKEVQIDLIGKFLDKLIEDAPKEDIYAITGVKTIEGDDKVGGYLIPFGSTTGGKDLHKEYFMPETDIMVDMFLDKPALFHHGLDSIGPIVIGRIKSVVKKDAGWWAEAILDKSGEYWAQIVKLIKMGILHWSSGTLPHLVEKDPDGRIKRWPLVEGSLTPTPAEPRMTNVVMLKSAIADSGLEFNIDEELLEEKEQEGEEGKEKVSLQGSSSGGDIKIDIDIDLSGSDGLKNAAKSEAEGSKESEGSSELNGSEEESRTEGSEEGDTELDNKKEVGDTNKDKMEESETDSKNNKQKSTKDLGDFNMNDQIFALIGALAIAQSVDLTQEETKTVADKVTAHVKGLIGEEEEITNAYLKLALSSSDFKRQINAWIKEYAPEEEEAQEEEAETEAKGKGEGTQFSGTREELERFVEETVRKSDEAANKAGAGGESKHGQAHNGTAQGAVFIEGLFKKNKFEKLESAGDVAGCIKLQMDLARALNKPYIPDWDLVDILYDRAKSMGPDLEEFLEDPEQPDGVPVSIKMMDHWAKERHQGTKADEVFHATQTGYGQEWIPDFWQATLWLEARSMNPVFSLFRRFNMPSNPYNIPLQKSPGSVFAVPETTDASQVTTLGTLPVEKVETAKTNIYAHGLGNQILLSRRAIEDNIIDAVMEARNTQRKMLADGMDYTVLNADTNGFIEAPAANGTTTSFSVFNAGATAVRAAAGVTNTGFMSADKGNIGFDGLVKLAFQGERAADLTSTNTLANDGSWGKAIGAVPDLGHFRTGQGYLHSLFYTQTSDLCWIMTPDMAYDLRDIGIYVLADVQDGSIGGNFVRSIDGIPVIISHDFGEAHTDGKIHGITTASIKNDHQRAILVYKPHFLIGFRREVETDMRASIFSDTVQMGIVLRYGMIMRDTERQSLYYMANVDDRTAIGDVEFDTTGSS